MKRTESIERLTNAFKALDSEQKGNLLGHLEAGTPILCGHKADLWEFQGAG